MYYSSDLSFALTTFVYLFRSVMSLHDIPDVSSGLIHLVLLSCVLLDGLLPAYMEWRTLILVYFLILIVSYLLLYTDYTYDGEPKPCRPPSLQCYMQST